MAGRVLVIGSRWMMAAMWPSSPGVVTAGGRGARPGGMWDERLFGTSTPRTGVRRQGAIRTGVCQAASGLVRSPAANTCSIRGGQDDRAPAHRPPARDPRDDRPLDARAWLPALGP